MTQENTKTGSCLCREVAFEVTGPLRPIIACHCIQCRKTTGHFLASTSANHQDFTLTKETELQWYRSSDMAKRGFCATCGSTMFWQKDGADYISIAAGTIDGDSGLNIVKHIFSEFAGDYYNIDGNKS